MNHEYAYKPNQEVDLKSPELNFGRTFDKSELFGLFKNRGKDKDLFIHENNFSEIDKQADKILADIISHIKTENSGDSASYFPEGFIEEVLKKLGQHGLDLLFSELRKRKIEWGAVLRPETITEALAKKIKKAGCSFVMLDFPSASRELLLARGYSQTTLESISRAMDLLDKQGIRIGIDLEFGITGEALKSGVLVPVTESKQSAEKNIQFIKERLMEGKGIAFVNLSLFGKQAKSKPANKNIYPYNRFKNWQSTKANLPPEILDHILKKSVKEIGEVLNGQDLYGVDDVYKEARKGRLAMFIDFNSASITTPVFTSEENELIESIPVDVRHLAEHQNKSVRDHREDPVVAAKALGIVNFNITERARMNLADIMQLSGVNSKEYLRRTGLFSDFKLKKLEQIREAHIAIAPNTTQAINWALAMVAVSEKLLKNSSIEQNFVITDAEHYSAKRALKKIADRSNFHGREHAASFQDFGQLYYYSKPRRLRPQNINWEQRQASVLYPESALNISAQVDASTKMVIFSHVIRDSGEILDVKKIIRAIKSRNPNTWVLVDGAQALGALPQFSVEDLGCDFYVATPHKTLNAYPFGVLYMSDRALTVAPKMIKERNKGNLNIQIPYNSFFKFIEYDSTQDSNDLVLNDGMLSPYEPWSFAMNFLEPKEVRWERGRMVVPDINYDSNYYNSQAESVKRKLDKNEQVRAELKQYAEGAFKQNFLDTVEILSPVSKGESGEKKYSNFIFSFSFKGLDNKKLAECMWVKYKIGLTYIARSNCLRISFSPFNTPEQIDSLVLALKEELSSPDYNI